MIHTLENNQLRIKIADHGAELSEIYDKTNDRQVLWNADPAYWKRHAPVLFPNVGRYYEDHCLINGRSYTSGQHGFARDMEFTLESQTDNEIWFVLRSNEETLAKYPYEFVLKLGYRLDGAKVEVLWHVENPSEEELPFAIGGHPAFYCPVTSGVKQSDCYIQFDVAGPLKCSTIDGYLVGDRVDTYELEDGMLRIDEHLFDNDALIIEKQNIKKVSLCDPKKQVFLTIELDAPLFGIWRPADPGAPFVCIEPWYGRSDRIGYAGELRDREYENVLAAGENWDVGYTILV